MERPVSAATAVVLREERAPPGPAFAHPAAPPPAPLRRGEGRAAIARCDGASAVVACASTSPLRLLVPRARGDLAWLVAANHGGGLVAGDAIAIGLDVGAGATALLSTQASTKVYRSPGPHGPTASQRIDARVAAGGVLAILPHPVSPFEGARYAQSARLELAPGASVAWLDAVTAGRVARAERWAARAFRSRTEVTVGGRVVATDALRLAPGDGAPVAERLAGFELVATAIVLGPAFAHGARALVAALGATPAARGERLLAAASPLADGLVLRVASADVEAGLLFLRDRLRFVTGLIGADPFARSP
ncbi:MAG TPA: urease accessory protein UreD [Anaeromyxobacteraceae bacterium]|nr:urease accessory protein UreD [Anaeromyxobacteraceae bacterium]